MRLGEFFQHIDRGGDRLALAVLHRLGQVQLVEEHVAELLGRIDVEFDAGVLVDLARLRGDLALQIASTLFASAGVSIFTPACSMRASTGTSGRSISS